MKTFLYNNDPAVARWTFEKFQIKPTSYEMAMGIIDNGELVGSVIWHAYNGNDIEISYYGPKTMTLGLARTCARIAVDYFGVSRVTARTAKNNKAMTRGVRKIGFEYEGIRHNAYGEHDAVMYGLYGKNLARLAGKELH